MPKNTQTPASTKPSFSFSGSTGTKSPPSSNGAPRITIRGAPGAKPCNGNYSK